MSYNDNRQYNRVRSGDYARSNQPSERNPYDRWREAEVEVSNRQLIRRPTSTTVTRRPGYTDAQYNHDESSDDHVGAGQLIIHRPSSNALQGIIRRAAEPRIYATDSRSYSRHESEQPLRLESHYPHEPVRSRVHREVAPPRREPLRQIRREGQSHENNARMGNISRLENEIADLERRLRDYDTRSCSDSSSTRHGGHGSSHSGHSISRYRLTYVSRRDQDTNEDDYCPCCEGTCDC